MPSINDDGFLTVLHDVYTNHLGAPSAAQDDVIATSDPSIAQHGILRPRVQESSINSFISSSDHQPSAKRARKTVPLTTVVDQKQLADILEHVVGEKPSLSSELDQDIARAVFDIGLRQSSPKVLMPLMAGNSELTTEHIKSHLQKVRLHSDRSKDEFMNNFDTQMHAAFSHFVSSEKCSNMLSELKELRQVNCHTTARPNSHSKPVDATVRHRHHSRVQNYIGDMPHSVSSPPLVGSGGSPRSYPTNYQPQRTEPPPAPDLLGELEALKAEFTQEQLKAGLTLKTNGQTHLKLQEELYREVQRV